MVFPWNIKHDADSAHVEREHSQSNQYMQETMMLRSKCTFDWILEIINVACERIQNEFFFSLLFPFYPDLYFAPVFLSLSLPKTAFCRVYFIVNRIDGGACVYLFIYCFSVVKYQELSRFQLFYKFTLNYSSIKEKTNEQTKAQKKLRSREGEREREKRVRAKRSDFNK